MSLRTQGQAPCLRESITQAFKGLLKAALAVALLVAVLVAVLADAHAAAARDDAKVVISSLQAESETVTEGSDAVFILTRSGDTSAEVSVGVDIRGHRKIMSAETRRLLNRQRPDGMATFAAGSSTAEFALSTQADIRIEGNGELILRIARAQNVSVTGARSARVLVEDDDVPEITLELRANGERVRPQGGVLRAEVDEGSPPDVQYRFVCPTAGYEYGGFDWGTSFPWVAGEYDGRHPIWKSYGNIHRYVCNRDGTRFLHNSWAGPTDGEINLHLVSANPDNWINEVEPSHHGYRYAADPDSVSFGRCRGEFCPRYRIGSPNRIEITLLNANPVISVEALDAEVEEGETARFRLTRHWPDDRWNEEFLNEALATTLVLLGSVEFGEATNEKLPTQHTFGVREGSVVFEVPTIEDESPDSGERSITIAVLPDTTPQGVNPAGKYDVVDVIPGVTPEGGSARTATVRIREDDVHPVTYPSIEISDATAVEGANSMEFMVTLNQVAELDASVDWNLSLGTATAGEDYVVVSGTLNFPAGSTTATIDVPLIDDLVVEDNETFTVTLSNPVNVRLMENAVETIEISAFGTIEDNDEPSTEVAVSLSIHEVAESAGIRGGIVAVSASLNNAAFAQDTVLAVRVRDGTAQTPEDYARVEDIPLTLEAGATSGSASFTLRPVDDSIDEDDETISVAVTGKSDLEIVWNGASEVVIADDDTRGVAVSPVSLMVDEGATATYTVRLTSEPTGKVSVAPFHEGGDPDIAASPVLAFDSLNWYLAQTVTVTAAEDPDAKDDVAAIGHRVSGADYGTVAAESVAVTVTDDETESSEVLLAADPSVVREGSQAVPITVTARLASGSRDVDTVIGISVAPGSAVEGADYAAVPPFAITISAGAVSGRHAFSFSSAPDDLDEPAETVRIAGTVSDAALAVSSALLTIEDGNAAPTVSLKLSDDSIGEAGGESTVTAFMSHASSAETTVTIAVAPVEPAEARDFELSGTTLSIPAGWTTSSDAIVITALNNDVDARNKTLTISGTVANRLGLPDPAEVPLAITDDDTRGVAVSPVFLTVDEGATATYTVRLASEPTGNVSVAPFHAGGDPDIAASPVLAFDSSNWYLVQTVTVAAAEDPDAEDDAAAIGHRVSGADYSSVAAESVAVTVTDDETESSEVRLAADPSAVQEGAEAVPVTVTASLGSGSRDVDTVIGISVAPGSAVEGADYAAVPPFVITIPAGAVSGTHAFSFSAAPDDLDEPAETVRIAGAVSGSALAVSSALLTIEDGNAAPTVSLMLSDDSIGEAGEKSTVTAVMSHASSVKTTVTITVTPVEPAQTRDFRLSRTTLSIPAGRTTSSGAVVITARNNDVDARNKTLTISGTVANRLGLANPADVSLAITDDDTRGVAVSPVSLTVDEGATAAYTVRLTSKPTGNVSVAPFHAGGDPDIAASPVRAFDSSNWYLAQTVTVTAAEDPDAEDDAAVIGHRVSGADYSSVAAKSVAVTVTDDETESSEVRLAADPSVVREGAEAVPITVTASLDSGSRDVDTVIGISVAPGSAVEGADYAAVPPFAITIPAGAVSGRHAFSFSSAPDDLDELAETVRIAGAVSDPALAVSSALLTIEDGNAAPTVSLMLSDDSIGEADGESTVTAFMSHASSAKTTVTIAVAPIEPAETRDFKLSGTTLSIPAGWTTSSGAIVITALNNDVNARDKTLTISGTVANRLGLADPAEVSLTITDDDRAGVSASPVSLLVMEEDASGAVYSVVLDSEPVGPVAVSVSGMAGSDVSVSPARLAFTPSNWHKAQKVRVTAGADDDSRDDRVVLKHHAAGGGYVGAGAPSVAVTVFDNDRRIALSVDPPSIGEGAGANDIVVKATHAEEAADVPVTVHVTVGSGSAPNPAIAGADFEPVGSFAIVIPDGAESGTGTFTFTPIEDEEVEEDEIVSITGASDTPAVAVSGAELVITDNDEHPLRALSILDSTAGENDGSISFQVRLDAASSALIRVRYATEDGTALAGIDYEPRSGILAIAPGALGAELTVPVRMDSVDEGKERFRVRLSDPEHAIFADSEAVGTIINADSLPSAWLIRFGRAVAEDIAESVASRAETAQASGVEVEIANQFLGGLPDAALDGGNGNFTRSWPVTHEEFLDGSSIKATKAAADGGALSVWGSGSVSRFTGTEQGDSLEGESSTGILGADYRSGSRAIGFLLSRSTGKGTYGSGDGGGRISAKMAGLYPFFHAHPMDRYSIWGVAGHGRGKIRLEPREGPTSEAGISMAMAALGTRGVVGNASGIDVAVETDGFLVRTRSEAVPGLSATDSQAGRVRVGLEGEATLEIDGFGSVVPGLGLGMRYDSGDAASGYGIDFGGGLALYGVRTGISAELRGRALLVHEAERVSDWGWSGSLHFDPAPSSDRGVDFSLSSSRGVSTGGRADALWNVETIGGLLEESTGSPATSVDAEIGYGVLVAGGKFIGRPAIGIGTSGSERTYRTGYTLRLAKHGRIGMELGLEAYRRIGVQDREHGARVEIGLHW